MRLDERWIKFLPSSVTLVQFLFPFDQSTKVEKTLMPANFFFAKSHRLLGPVHTYPCKFKAA